MSTSGTATKTKKLKGRAKKTVIVLLLVLPTLLAILSFFLVYNDLYFSPANIYDITLYGPDGEMLGTERNFLRNAEKDGLVSLFSPITDNLSGSSRIPDDFDRSNHFRAEVQYMNMKNEYDFYFSLEDLTGYCTVGINTYKLGKSDTEKFLSSSFAEELYDIADPPVMYSISGNVIVPETVSWNYKTVGGYYNTTKIYETNEKILTYDMSGALGLSFDREPTSCTVKVFKEDQEVFSGNNEDLSYISFEKGEKLRLEVRAIWEYSSEADYYGTTTYLLDATVNERAEIHLTGDTFAIDSFCGIFCTNVKDPSKVVFVSDPPLPMTPEFQLSRENAVAILPIVPETPTGEYKVAIKYGATTEFFTLNITQRADDETKTVDCLASPEAVEPAFSDDAQNEIEALKEFAAEKSKGEKLFYGTFLNYTDEEIGASEYSLFGDTYINDVANVVYYSEGHEYRFEGVFGGVSVPALNSGVIIKKGYNDSLGNYVIVSHGCGLATWYAHLSTVDVAEGDYVVKGETVGKTGTTGLSSVENVMVYVTLDSSFMNPRYLCGEQFD